MTVELLGSEEARVNYGLLQQPHVLDDNEDDRFETMSSGTEDSLQLSFCGDDLVGNNEVNDDVSAAYSHYLSEQPKLTNRSWNRWKKHGEVDPYDVEQYMTKREMTPTQERWNALSILPNPAYCLYFLLTAQWLNEAAIEKARTTIVAFSAVSGGDWMETTNLLFGDEHGCLQTTADTSAAAAAGWWWNSMPALPPLPVLAVVLGICLHAPFSFIYHWKYAHALSAAARSRHWSRRMDQSMIHVCSMFMSYAVSGSWNYFAANALYNLDCCLRQFRPTVRPKSNQMRILISMIAYTLPLVKRGEWADFGQLWAVFLVSGWFFVRYPVGGWSHAIFHFVVALVPPLLMQTAMQLPASQSQIQLAAQCYVLRNESSLAQ